MKRLISHFLVASLLAAVCWGQAMFNAIGPDGVARDYTLKAHPRGLFDGPFGVITARQKDPDGMGPLVAPNYSRITGQALALKIANTRADCLVGGQIKNCRGVYQMASEAAWAWYMCNQCTVPWNPALTYLDFAKDLYLHLYDYGFKRWHGSHKFGDALAGDAGDNPSGMVDYGGDIPMKGAAGFTLIRDQFTPEERTTVARYFVNGLLPGDFCKYASVRQTGRISKTGNTVTLLDGSWPADVAVGNWLDVKGYKDASGNIITTMEVTDNYWAVSGVIQSVSGNTLTMLFGSGGSSMKDFQEGYYFTYPPFEANTCGLAGIFLMHSDAPAYVEPSPSQNRFLLNQDVPALDWDTVRQNPNGVVQNIAITTGRRVEPTTCPTKTIDGFSPPSPTNPWKATLTSGWTAEVVYVEGQSNCTISVRRGLFQHGWATTECPSWDTICWSYDPNAITIMQHQPRGERLLNTGLNNRELTRNQSVLMIATVFADDDPRAAALLSKAMSYFSTDAYKLATKFYTIFNYSIGSYNIGRGAYYSRMAMMLQNSIASPAVTYGLGRHLIDQAWIYPYWVTPWAPKELIDVGLDAFESCIWRMNTSGTGANNSSIRDCSHIALQAQVMFPNEDSTKYGWSFLTQNSSHAFHTTAAMLASSEYGGESMPLWLMLLAGYPDDIQQAADRTALTTTFARTNGQASSPGGLGYSVGVSLFGCPSAWSPRCSYFFRIAYPDMSDKMTGEGNLASYGVGKNGWLIYSPGMRQRFDNNHFKSKIDWGKYTKAPYWPYCYPSAVGGTVTLTDGVCPGVNYPAYSTRRSNFLWVSADEGVQAKGGSVSGGTFVNLHGMNYAWRQTVNIEGAGGKDFIFVFDDFSKTVNEQFTVRTMYPNNLETVQTESNRTIAEGWTAIASDFSQVESRTGGTEGPVAKLLHKWQFTGGTTMDGIYDLPAKVTSNSDTWQEVTVCADATVQQPCRVKFGASEATFTAPVGTWTWHKGGSGMAYKRIYLTFDPTDMTFKGRYQAPGPGTVPICTGAITCTSATPGASEVILASPMWGDNGFLDGCNYPQRISSGNGPFHHGTCHQAYNPFASDHPVYGKYDTARSVQLQGAPATSGTVWQWMRATESLDETLAGGEEKTVTGVGVNHKAFQLNDPTSPVVVVLPLNNARATELQVVTNHAGNATVLFCGLTESSSYDIRRNGVNVAGGVSVGAGEACAAATGVPSGTILATRIGGVSGNLEASAGSVAASATVGSANPANQSVSIAGVGAALGAWTAEIVGTAPWLSFVGPSSGTGNGSVTLAFAINALSPGIYSANLQFTAAGFSNSPLVIPVTATVNSPGSPVIVRTPTSLTFNAAQGGGNPASQNVSVTVLNGPVTVSVADDQPWCAASPTSFSGSGSATNVTVSMTTGALTAGIRDCTLTFSAPGAANVTVLATFVVSGASAINLDLGGVTNFETTATGNAPPPKPLPFGSLGGALDQFLAVSNAPWLSVSPSSGTTATELSVSINPAGLAAGQHCASISVSSTTANVANSPVVVPVCADLAAAPSVGIAAGPYLAVGQAASIGVTVTGGVAAYSWQLVSGTLPTGLSLSGTSGTTINITGTPTQLGDWPITMGVYDVNGAQATQAVVLRVRPAANQADFDLTVKPVEGGAIARAGMARGNANDAMTLVVRNGEGTVLQTKILPAGRAYRMEWLRDLTPPGPYTVEALLPTGSVTSPGLRAATKTYIPLPVTGGNGVLVFRARPPAGEGITDVRVFYGSNRDEVESGGTAYLEAACSYPSECVVSGVVPKGATYVKPEWRAGAAVVRRDPGVGIAEIR